MYKIIWVEYSYISVDLLFMYGSRFASRRQNRILGIFFNVFKQQTDMKIVYNKIVRVEC